MNFKPVNFVLPVSTEQKSQASILTLPFVADAICLNFINTIDWRLDPLRTHDTLGNYSDLLTFALRTQTVSVDSYTRLGELAADNPAAAVLSLQDAKLFRDALAMLVDELHKQNAGGKDFALPSRTLAILNAVRIKAHDSESLEWMGEQFGILQHPEDEGLNLPWLCVVRDAETLLLSPRASRIRVCAAEGCGWAFLDTSKNGTRRWCSMKLCGNREKAARFKAKINNQ